MKHRPSVALVVLTYNWHEALFRVLQSVEGQSFRPDEVIIADDGSTRETENVVEAARQRLPVPVRHVWQEDIGFRAARARNRAIAVSRCDYVILLDGDMILHRDFVLDHARMAATGCFLQGGRLKATLEESKRILHGGEPVFAPWSRADFGEFDGTRRLYAFRQPLLARMKALSGNGGRVMSCNMSFWKRDLLRVNGFDERMEGYGAEDRDLAVRLENGGLRRRALKWGALAVHLWHATRAPVDVNAPDLPNNKLLRESIERLSVRCEMGIDSHHDLCGRNIAMSGRDSWIHRDECTA